MLSPKLPEFNSNDYNGFSISRQYGDWNLEPLTAASPCIIVVCRKRAWTQEQYPCLSQKTPPGH
jgi:hypothetical protein